MVPRGCDGDIDDRQTVRVQCGMQTEGYRPLTELTGLFLSQLDEREIHNGLPEWMAGNVTFPTTDPFSGPYDPDRCPPQRGIAEAMSQSHPAHEIVLMGSQQWGKTTLTTGLLCQLMDISPGDMQVTVPGDDDVAKWQSGKLERMMGMCPALEHVMVKSHDRTHKVGEIELPNKAGRIVICGSGTKQTFANETIRIMVVDDMDRCRALEGDLAQLARNRTVAHRANGRKIIFVSTPTDTAGHIYRAFLNSSQNYYQVPCPHCTEAQELEPRALKWTPGDYSSVHFECKVNKCRITQDRITWMTRRGAWWPKRPELSGIVEGFHLWQGYLPLEMASWAELAQSHDNARAALAIGDDSLMRVVTNHGFGLPYKAQSDKKLDELGKRMLLNRHRGVFNEADLASQIIVRTAGCDVQPGKNGRLETGVQGWGVKYETWSLDYDVRDGEWSDNALWDEWCDWLTTRKPPIQAVCVDAGFQRKDKRDNDTLKVTEQLTRLLPRFMRAGIMLWATKGRGGVNQPFWPAVAPQPGNLSPAGIMLPVSLYVDHGKSWLRLCLEAGALNGPGAFHIDERRDRKWIAQLLAERRRQPGDKTMANWQKIGPKRKNEAGDIMVMARGALEGYMRMVPAIRAPLMGQKPAPPPPVARPAAAQVSGPADVWGNDAGDADGVW